MPPAPSPPSETYEWNTVETHTFVWDGDDIVLERIAFRLICRIQSVYI